MTATRRRARTLSRKSSCAASSISTKDEATPKLFMYLPFCQHTNAEPASSSNPTEISLSTDTVLSEVLTAKDVGSDRYPAVSIDREIGCLLHDFNSIAAPGHKSNHSHRLAASCAISSSPFTYHPSSVSPPFDLMNSTSL